MSRSASSTSRRWPARRRSSRPRPAASSRLSSDGETGFLVRLDRSGDSFEPTDPAAFAAEFATRVNRLISDPQLAREMGRAGRIRAIEHFSWSAIADQVVALYENVLDLPRP